MPFFTDTLFTIKDFPVLGWHVVAAGGVVLLLIIIIAAAAASKKKKAKRLQAAQSQAQRAPVQEQASTATFVAEQETPVAESEPAAVADNAEQETFVQTSDEKETEMKKKQPHGRKKRKNPQCRLP